MRLAPICLLVLYASIAVNAEMFTAVADLQNLLHTIRAVARNLENYLETEDQRLEKIKRLNEEYRKLHVIASKNEERFVSNPINAFVLMKRLTSDWEKAMELMDAPRDTTRNRIQQERVPFPSDEDLRGAATALVRLQETYLLNASALARGFIGGAPQSAELTSDDCFELGRQAYALNHYSQAKEWMEEALERLDEGTGQPSHKAAVLEYMAYSAFMLGNIGEAVNLTEKILQIDPEHPRAVENLAYYVDALRNYGSQESANKTIGAGKHPTLAENSSNDFTKKHQYQKLCRGERVKSPAEEKDLKCRHFTNGGDPYLLLQPAKEEEVNSVPRLVVYHHVLSDYEIQVVKQLATPKLTRATVQNTKTGALEYANYRVSKSAWLADSDHEVVRRISQRIEAITGLETDTAEQLQVVNYGIGGHYKSHYDFATINQVGVFEHLGTGNRIATWINYMSDVEAGGATVFPAIGVSLKPIKGSAAFWFNLLKNGEGDVKTLHAACPVLMGSKWVSNKWFHEEGQEFRRPCSLNPNE